MPLPSKKVYSSTYVRKRMVSGEDWERLVPKCLADFIEEIDGVDRLRDLSKRDKALLLCCV